MSTMNIKLPLCVLSLFVCSSVFATSHWTVICDTNNSSQVTNSYGDVYAVCHGDEGQIISDNETPVSGVKYMAMRVSPNSEIVITPKCRKGGNGKLFSAVVGSDDRTTKAGNPPWVLCSDDTHFNKILCRNSSIHHENLYMIHIACFFRPGVL